MPYGYGYNRYGYGYGNPGYGYGYGNPGYGYGYARHRSTLDFLALTAFFLLV